MLRTIKEGRDQISPPFKADARRTERSRKTKRSGSQARFDPSFTQKPLLFGSHLWSGLRMGFAETQEPVRSM